MKSKLEKALSAMLIVVMILLAGTLSIWNLQTVAGTAVPARYQGISFYQVDYQWNGSIYPNSDTGKIVVDIEILKRETGLESGYVNCYTRQGWVVQNLIVIEDYPYETTSMFFDLGSFGDVREIWIHIGITADPSDDFSSGTLVDYPVSDAVYNPAGADDEPVIFQKTPTPPKTGYILPPFEPLGLSYSYTQPDHPNVQAAKHQCVPAAYANNLQYLENRYQTPISHDLVPGWNQLSVGAFPSNSLPAQLDVYMDRGPVIIPYQEDGTNYSDALQGILDYTLPIFPLVKIRHQGLAGGSDFGINPIHKSYHQGVIVNFDFILDEMEKGHAVTLLFWRYDSDGLKTTGHMVQLIAAGYILGIPFIKWRHDGAQADPVDDPDFTEGLEDCQRYLVDIDDDGLLNVLSDPLECPDKIPEVVLIVTLESLNAPPEKPSTPSGETQVTYSLPYGYTSSTTDPDDDKLEYLFDWGDGTYSGWLGLYDSGETVSASHNWFLLGSHDIRVKARDTWGAESQWSDALTVTAVPNIPDILGWDISILEDAKIGLKYVDEHIDKVLRDLIWSLNENYWVDESHLDPKHGAKVFDELKNAVIRLENLMDSKRVPNAVREACQEAIESLMGVGRLLAEIAYEEALSIDEAVGGDEPWDNELEKSDEALAKAETQLDAAHYSKALDLLRKAWKEATRALKLMP